MFQVARRRCSAIWSCLESKVPKFLGTDMKNTVHTGGFFSALKEHIATTKQSKSVVHWIEDQLIPHSVAAKLLVQYSAALFCTFVPNGHKERQCVLPPKNCTRSNLPWQHQWHWLSPVRSLLCASPFELACDTKIGREVPVDAICSCQENTELETLRCFEIVLLSTGLVKTLVSDKGQLNTILGGTHRRPTRFSWSLFCSGFLAKLLAADLKRSGFRNYYVHQSARVRSNTWSNLVEIQW